MRTERKIAAGEWRATCLRVYCCMDVRTTCTCEAKVYVVLSFESPFTFLGKFRIFIFLFFGRKGCPFERSLPLRHDGPTRVWLGRRRSRRQSGDDRLLRRRGRGAPRDDDRGGGKRIAGDSHCSRLGLVSMNSSCSAEPK